MFGTCIFCKQFCYDFRFASKTWEPAEALPVWFVSKVFQRSEFTDEPSQGSYWGKTIRVFSVWKSFLSERKLEESFCCPFKGFIACKLLKHIKTVILSEKKLSTVTWIYMNIRQIYMYIVDFEDNFGLFSFFSHTWLVYCNGQLRFWNC